MAMQILEILLKKPVLLEECGGYADEDADDTVVECFPVRKAVYHVGEKSDDYGRKSSPDHGGEKGADVIHVNGNFKSERDFCGYNVREECCDDKSNREQEFFRFSQRELFHNRL
jgi:hypothetical protein